MANKNTQFPHVTPVKKDAKNGPYKWRIHEEINGKMYDKTGKRDDDGNPFLTKKDAWEYREKVLADIKAGLGVAGKHIDDITLGKLYEAFKLSTEASRKATGTLTKHDSVWRNHVGPKFANRKISDITTYEMHEFITDIYNNKSYKLKGVDTKYSFEYLESIIKLFQLLYSFANRKRWISNEKYLDMFGPNAPTKLKMPERREDDEEKTEPEIYTEMQLKQMEDIFKRGDANLLTSYMLARYAGLRKGEIFGLRWNDIDWESGYIWVKKQMQRNTDLNRWELTKLKTKKSKRYVIMPSVLQEYLYTYYHKQENERKKYGLAYKNRDYLYDTVDNCDILTEKLSHNEDFVNRMVDGQLLTINSTKRIAETIKKELNPSSENPEKTVELHYHFFRHTYATSCAVNNIEEYMLCEMMGHKSIDVTRQYYISSRNEELNALTKKRLTEIFEPKEISYDSIHYQGVLKNSLKGIPMPKPITPEEMKHTSEGYKLLMDDVLAGNIPLIKVIKKEVLCNKDERKIIRYTYENGREEIIDITGVD